MQGSNTPGSSAQDTASSGTSSDQEKSIVPVSAFFVILHNFLEEL